MPDTLHTIRSRTSHEGAVSSDAFVSYTQEETSKLLFDLNMHHVELEAQNQELLRVQDELEKERDRYSNLYDYAPVGYITIDSKGIITDSNMKCSAMTGYDRISLQKNSVALLIAPDDRHLFERQFAAILRRRESRSCELRIRCKDGTVFFAALYANPLFDNDSRLADIRIAFVDISDSRRLQEERERRHKDESLGVLASGIAHDFNNLLCGLFSYLELAVCCTRNNEEAQGYLHKACRCFSQARSLTQQLLTFSRGGVPSRKATAIGPIINDAVKIALSGSNVECHTLILPDTPCCDIDSGQISQVLTNLLLNSRYAMHEGGTITVTVSTEHITSSNRVADLTDGRWVKIVVSDQGTGIPKDLLGRVFDPYFTTRKNGTGLGLSVVQSIIRKHTGTISILSAQGEGTEVTFYLPAADTAETSIVADTKKPAYGCGRILLMDDEVVIRDVVTKFLVSFGYRVTAVTCSDEAVTAYCNARREGDPYDAVILDLTIPGGEGGDRTIMRLKDIDPGVKAVVASGYSENAIMASPDTYGFVCGIIKPFRKQELQNVVSVALAKAT